MKDVCDICKKKREGNILVFDDDMAVFRCHKCFKKNQSLKNYQQCEVYSRVVGYLRPIKEWNEAKQHEFKKRKEYDIS